MFDRDGLKLDGWPENYDQCTEIIHEYTGPLTTVLDVGAHQGSLGLYAATRGAKRVICVEPNLGFFVYLWNNIDRNNLWGTVVHLPIGVGNEHGIALLNGIKISNEGLKIPIVPLAGLIKFFGPVDYLKIDIEEYEYQIFREENQALADSMSWVGFIDIELHAPYGSEMERVKRLLTNCGFDLKVGKTGNPHYGPNRNYE
uniref:Putative methyltransferase n=1 Tax=viral metagenome TaxID=1070528 RepID=A0A6H1ZGL4_9ZZZZ